MKANNLVSGKGLSLSQAQSISNLCHQRAQELSSELENINNYSKFIEINGKQVILETARPISPNIKNILEEVSTLHACQAFLVENIQTKEKMLSIIRSKEADISSLEVPKRPSFVVAETLPTVDESWGWEQLSASEINEFLEAESFAAHIGQFIHNNSKLSKLRKELPKIPAIEWMTIKDGEKTPVSIEIHHTSAQLLAIHEELAALHRKYEQRVNYFKAKVKNLVTIENGRIAAINNKAENEASKINNLKRSEFQNAYESYESAINSEKSSFEEVREKTIGEISQMRIMIDPRFQATIDKFLNT
jgi:hypothetical protein